MALLTEKRPVRLDPELEAAYDAIIKRYRGEKRKKVEDALLALIQEREEGTYGELIERGEVAAKEAAGG